MDGRRCTGRFLLIYTNNQTYKSRQAILQFHQYFLTLFLTKPLENLLEAKDLMRQRVVRKRKTKMPKPLVNTGVSAFRTIG